MKRTVCAAAILALAVAELTAASASADGRATTEARPSDTHATAPARITAPARPARAAAPASTHALLGGHNPLEGWFKGGRLTIFDGRGSRGNDQEHDALLARIGVPRTEPTMSSIPIAKLKMREPPVHRGLGETISELKTRPFVNRQVMLNDSERNAITHLSVDHGYNVRDDRGAHLSDATYQTRVEGVYHPLAERLQKELAVDPASFGGGRIAVVEGGRADSFNAVTLPNGSVLVHRRVIDVANKVGQAIAASSDSKELMKNITLVALDKFVPPAGIDPKMAQRYSDSFLATVIGHEMTHGMRYHADTGRPASMNPGFETREHETVSDAGGVDLATRAGYSPLGQASAALFFTVYEALSGEAGLPRGDHPEINHPAGVDRYAFMYRYLNNRVDEARPMYDGQNPRTKGAPYMTSEAKADFAKLPTPDAVRSYGTALAAKVNELARQQQPRIILVRIPYRSWY